jgi:pimeloyl-ACP methyl ester carboxylesterase
LRLLPVALDAIKRKGRGKLNNPAFLEDAAVSSVLHLGGNGHARVRLELAQEALDLRHPGLTLIDVPYPGFEGRPRAWSVESFLNAVAESCESERRGVPPARAAIASGIGGLIALAVRARGGLEMPLVLQAPVLWGLERRWFPRLMRWPFAAALLKRAFLRPWFQRRFERTHFTRPLTAEFRSRFFDGYARCAEFADFFDWFTPRFLRDLEQRFRAQPSALERVTVWWGGRDQVVTLEELRITEKALGVRWPVVEFADWGHYPMIDHPEDWADALADTLERDAREVEASQAVPRRDHPQTS